MKHPKHTLVTAFMLLTLCISLPTSGQAASWPDSFNRWLENFKAEARSKGISESTLLIAFNNVRPIPRVIELDRKQPEHKIGFDEYQAKALTPARIAEGRQLLRDNWSTLHAIERRYGVQAQYIVALWGMETSYGKNTGGFDIVASLATLAWEGRRGTYFRDELLKSLRILEDGHVTRGNFKGSWAGAMGQVQFMPTSWQRYAVDYNGDGHKDIWTTRADAWASAANYLSSSGWMYGQKWGRTVSIPSGLSSVFIDKNVRKTLAQWSAMGVRNSDGSALPNDAGVSAFLVKPTGANGKVFLAYSNLGTLMKWNNSTYFALSVGRLADDISDGSLSPQKTYSALPHHQFNE